MSGQPEFPRYVTQTGCTMQVLPPYSLDPEEVQGRRILHLTMEQPGDGRHVEIMLNPQERLWLSETLVEPWLNSGPMRP
jgi:hypothetical protein